MEIKVTGCNNCPFGTKEIPDDKLVYCRFNSWLENGKASFMLYDKTIPKTCPVKRGKDFKITIQ